MILQILFVVLLVVCNQKALAYSFPSNFAWGASTSAYQIEGAWNISGKGLSWDDWYNELENLPINQTGDVADDFYDRFKEDVALMKKIGLKNFRMSIAWTRVLPNGTVDQPNEAGITFYNNVFTELVNAGISPWVTLYHADFPQALSFPNATGSWLNPNISNIFNDYADFCFQNFGDKVKHWITLNEPSLAAWYGYGNGWGLPFRCSPSYSSTCASLGGGGNSSTEPYLAAHNLILSHAKAVQTYRNKYKATQGGEIGWTLNIAYALPWNVSDPNDIAAVDTYIQFQMGWFANPIVFGEYPQIMQEYVGDRLPTFNETEVELVKGAFDFFGINHYTTTYAHYTGIVGDDYGSDSRVIGNSSDIDGNPIGIVAESNWLYSYPPGMRGILNWTKNTYNNPPIVVLENGWDTLGESEMPIPEAIADYQRIDVLNSYIDNLVDAVTIDGVNVTGYFVWAFMDNFEWGSFTPRFGLVYVDYDNNLTRIPKASSAWYIEKTNNITSWALGETEYPYYSSDNFRNYLPSYEIY